MLAVASGTAALHLALLAVGVGPGDEVITTPITWPATANVIVHAGATPVFADVRDSDLNIDPDRVAELITEKTKAIVPVDLAGQPADLDPLLTHGIPLVEDAAHAAESVYRGRKIGSIAEATCFSLYATKNIAAGEGGLISTNDSTRRGVDREPAPHATRRRLALRHRRPRLQGEPVRRPGLDRARPAGQGRAARRDPATTVRALRRGGRGARRDRRRSPAIRATPTRTTSTSSGSTPSAPAAPATSTSGFLRTRTSRRASTSSRCTS